MAAIDDAAVTFDGFSKDLIGFLRELDANNSKAWFDAHRADYDTHFMAAAKAFVTAMGTVLPDLKAEPRVNGSIKRINRDIRFSKDKSPYTPAMHLVFWHGDKPKFAPGFHVRFGWQTVAVGAGLWAFSPEQLTAYRDAVLKPDAGAALRAALEQAARAGGGEVGEPHLKRVPAGFDADHPNADLLRYKGLIFGRRDPLPDELFDSRAVGYMRDRFKALAPVHNWLVDHVAA